MSFYGISLSANKKTLMHVPTGAVVTITGINNRANKGEVFAYTEDNKKFLIGQCNSSISLQLSASTYFEASEGCDLTGSVVGGSQKRKLESSGAKNNGKKAKIEHEAESGPSLEEDEVEEDGEEVDEEEVAEQKLVAKQKQQQIKHDKEQQLQEQLQKKQKLQQEATKTDKPQHKDQNSQQPAKAAPKPVSLGNGIKYMDNTIGTGEIVRNGKQLTMRYKGMLTSGYVFDSNMPKGRPFTFTLGSGEVIKGWDLGLQGMRVGGFRRIVIPPEMGYGRKGSPPTIPSNATLVFDVEVIKQF